MNERILKILNETSSSPCLQRANESQTRARIVDCILTALGWNHEDIDRERASGAGDYLDYELWAGNEPWMVVEAKREGRTFDLQSAGQSHRDGHLRSIGTLLSRGGPALREVMKQAAGYCNDRGIPLACVTNGYQWVFFRGLSRKTKPWNQGSAITFSGADSIQARFDDFLGCLGYDWAGTTFLPDLLDRQQHETPRPRIPRNLLPSFVRPPSTESIAQVRGVCEQFLSDIHRSSDTEMLERCYVRPGMAGDFDHTVQRLLKDTEDSLVSSSISSNLESTGPGRFAEQIARQEEANPIRDPIVVAGHVGAGKTTFLHRALGVFRDESSAICALVDLTGFGHGGTVDAHEEERRVATQILQCLGRACRTVLKRAYPHAPSGELKHADPFSAETLRTLLRDDIQREYELGKKVWDNDPSAWSKREYELLRNLKESPLELLPRYIRQIRSRMRTAERKKFPILIVLDNLDQATDDYQRCIYGFSERLARQTPAIVIVCIREDTFHAGRKGEGFLSSNSLSGVYHVAAPPLDHVLRHRVRYARLVVSERRLPKGQRAKSQTISDVCDILEQSLTPARSEGTEILAALAGHNMRDALALASSVVEGAQFATSSPAASGAFVLDCLIRARADGDALGRTRLVDLFDAPPSNPPCHALRARVLAYYAWTHEQDSRALLEDTERVLGRFATWGYPTWVVRDALKNLLDAGALQRKLDSNGGHGMLPARLGITASGFVHVTRLLELRPYRTAMAMITRWYDRELCDRFIEEAERAGGEAGTSVPDMELSSAPDFFEAYLAAMVTREDGRLVKPQIQGHPWIPEVLGRSREVVQAGQKAPATAASSDRPTPASASPPHRSQLPLVNVGSSEAGALPDPPILPSLGRDMKYEGTVWIPRILWALEWGRLAGHPRLTAADIARILTNYGDLDVPGENVARAFREHRSKSRRGDLWTCTKRRYEISNAGTLLIEAILGSGTGNSVR